MKRSFFALFVDVMGVQHDLVPTGSRTADLKRFNECRSRLEDFHTDLQAIVGETKALLMKHAGIPEPDFVAEFSDSAFVVGEQFASVAIPAVHLMRRALRHEYPLRGGIGAGSFSHEASGVRTSQEKHVWSTSSFLGGAIVTAYQAERSATPGMRILIHPHVMRRNTEPYLTVFPIPLIEQTSASSHELRIWQTSEITAALSKLQAFREKQNVPDRAVKHYDATIEAYKLYAKPKKPLPHILPAFWLFE